MFLSNVSEHFNLGTRGRETVGDWENGVRVPEEKLRREPFIDYLWVDLLQRVSFDLFQNYWNIICEVWGWHDITEEEKARLLSSVKMTWRGLEALAHTPLASLIDRKNIKSSLALKGFTLGRPVSNLTQLRVLTSYDFCAGLITAIWYKLTRDVGATTTGIQGFRVLSRFNKFPELQINALIGLSDSLMILGGREQDTKRKDEALDYCHRAAMVAKSWHGEGMDFYLAVAHYQNGHILEHFENPQDDSEAAKQLRESYAQFLELRNSATYALQSLRWLGWSALFLSQQLRGSGKRFGEARDWMLTALILATYLGHFRQQAYILAQIARLEAAMGYPQNAKFYIEFARKLDAYAVGKASGDPTWDKPINIFLNDLKSVTYGALPTDDTGDFVHKIIDLRPTSRAAKLWLAKI